MSLEEYIEWLKAEALADEQGHASNRKTAENHQRESEEVIANQAALSSIRPDSMDELARHILGNPP